MLDFDEESKRTESEEVAANGKAPDKIDDEYDYEAKYEKPMQSTTLRAATGSTKPANTTPIKVTPRSRQTSNR